MWLNCIVKANVNVKSYIRCGDKGTWLLIWAVQKRLMPNQTKWFKEIEVNEEESIKAWAKALAYLDLTCILIIIRVEWNILLLLQESMVVKLHRQGIKISMFFSFKGVMNLLAIQKHIREKVLNKCSLNLVA